MFIFYSSRIQDFFASFVYVCFYVSYIVKSRKGYVEVSGGNKGKSLKLCIHIKTKPSKMGRGIKNRKNVINRKMKLQNIYYYCYYIIVFVSLFIYFESIFYINIFIFFFPLNKIQVCNNTRSIIFNKLSKMDSFILNQF